jgi:hypothetical protein
MGGIANERHRTISPGRHRITSIIGFSKALPACLMHVMGMRQHDCRWRDFMRVAGQSVPESIMMRAFLCLISTMASMPGRARIDLAASAENPNFKNVALCRHFCRQVKFRCVVANTAFIGSVGKG